MAVKLKDIASETGVSISTVSRILNKDATRKAGDKTAARVIDAAQRMGFFSEGKNVRLSSSGISISKTYSIGCILTSAHETFVSPFFSAMLAAIENQLAKYQETFQYNLFVTSINAPGFSRFLTTDTLDCAIMLGRTSSDNINLLRNNIPNLVYAGANRISDDIDEVICDGYAGILAAMEYLVSLGHKKIGFLGPTRQEHNIGNEYRYSGYMEGLKRAGLSVNESWIKDTVLTTAGAYDAAMEMIREKNLPTALFCGNDTVALGAMKAFADCNISVPGDISIMGFDNIDMANYVKPALTTIAIPTKELGRLAVKILLDGVETGRKYPLRVNLPFHIVERESCRSIL